MSGKQIVFCGPDGSGKSTQAAKLKEHFDHPNINIPNILTRHPGATKLGKELRHLLLHSDNEIDSTTEALLFAADNSAYINQTLKPTLNKGVNVIADRNNFISSLAYQIASGVDRTHLDLVHQATGDCPRIDLLFIFLVPPEIAAGRLDKKKLDNFESRGDDYVSKVVSTYEKMTDGRISLANFVNKDRIIKIDGTGPIDFVFSRVVSQANKILRKG